MKLIGSKQEKEFQAKLENGRKALFDENCNPKLLNAIKNAFPKMKTAYVIEWVPEQTEEIYGVLVNTDIVAWIELNRFDSAVKPIIEETSVDDYKKKLKKIKRIELMVALNLAKNDLN